MVMYLSIAKKLVTHERGLLSFEIPDSWVEETEPDGRRIYFYPSEESGTLRVHVLTFQAPESKTMKTPAEAIALAEKTDRRSIRTLPNGHALGESISRTLEDGEKITLYWWYLCEVTEPSLTRIAMFSYTVPTSGEGSPGVVDEVNFLRRSIENAKFER